MIESRKIPGYYWAKINFDGILRWTIIEITTGLFALMFGTDQYINLNSDIIEYGPRIENPYENNSNP